MKLPGNLTTAYPTIKPKIPQIIAADPAIKKLFRSAIIISGLVKIPG